MKSAVEHIFQGPTQSISNYDSSKTLLGSLMYQKTGVEAIDKWAGPMQIGLARPMEQSVAITVAFPHAIVINPDLHWVFVAENSTAAVTRRISLYTYQPSTSVFNWKGFVTMNFVTNAGNKSIRGLRALRYLHTNGSASASGTSVSGTGTGFVSERMAVGARIGFGSTDPNSITTWYEIASITNDNSLTLTTPVPSNISDGPYVIEEVRIAVSISNATITNGGLFLIKGLNFNTFQTTGINIAEAGTVDNIRGIYWLADASTVTNTVPCGLALDDISSNSQQFVWILNGTTTAQIYKYNLRAPLSGLTSGKSTSAFVLATGLSGTLTGTSSQLNNGRIFAVNHGPAAGSRSFWFATTTRIYRCVESAITSGSTTFLADNMVEIPPGSINTYAATSALQSVDYSDSIDRLIVMSSGSAGNRSYITQYNTISSPFDHIFLVDTKQTDQSTADGGGVIHPTINASSISVWSESGIVYLVRNGTTASLNQLYSMPLAAHWTYAGITGQRIITPALSTSGATRFYRVYYSRVSQLGTATLGMPSEPCRIYARTSGISDNSGSWTLIDDSGNISGLTPGTSIQFMFEFKVIGTTCIPNRIYSVTCTYEDSNTDSHYNPSATKSSAATRAFAWRQVTPWGGNIPNLSIKLYDAATGSVILSDTVSSSASGVWRYSTDGTNWLSWSPSADLVGNYIRYTANSLPTGISVKAVVTNNG